MSTQRKDRLTTKSVALATFTLCVTALVITLACRVITESGFDVTLNWKFWYRDYIGNLTITLLVFALTLSVKKSLVLSGVLIVMFQLSNAAKLSILGTPASPDDLLNIQNFFFLTEGWRRWVLFFVASIPLILGVAFIAWRKVSVWVTLVLITTAGVGVNAYSEPLRVALDTHIGNSVWNQPKNFRERGLALHLTQEVIRTISKVDKPPAREVVDNAQQQLSLNANATQKSTSTYEPASTHEITSTHRRRLEPEFRAVIDPEAKPTDRNVHVFVLESFFDPLSLGTDWIPEDPLPTDFRDLWKQTGYTQAMSPVFGGYTANAEFEVLCGFPVTRDAVFFEGWLRRAAPCLPSILTQLGYNTIASHPNVPGFWNRANAYQLVGFETYLSKADFDMTDSIGPLLMDHSMYEQVYQYISNTEPNAPIFNYMLTYHGHLPYPSNDNYPDKVAPGRDSALLNGYINQIWYKSRDLMQRLEIVRREDPDSLIVIFGDHLPFLGPNYDVYTQAWELPSDRSLYSGKQLKKITSTPLIVIDGKRGPLELGDVPLYRMPSIIMSLLGLHETQSFDVSLNPETLSVRPVYSMHYTSQNNATMACTDTNKFAMPCKNSEAWIQQVNVLIDDIFTGKQFSLEKSINTSIHQDSPPNRR